MSQSGNHFIRKPSEKAIRVVLPNKPRIESTKTQPLPETPRTLPDRPAVLPSRPVVPPAKPRVATETPRSMTEIPRVGSPLRNPLGERKASSYTKVFRWRMPDGQAKEPATVEIAGTFTNWQKVPLTRDGALDSWHATVHNIQGHKTHHYMLLVDGQPAHDKNADGVTPPHGPHEAEFQLMTPRGPRVFMLFAQAK